jgi:hypothetical protein
MTTRTVIVVPNGGRGRFTIAGIQLPGNPRLVREGHWTNGAHSFEYEDGSTLVLSREEEDRLPRIIHIPREKQCSSAV